MKTVLVNQFVGVDPDGEIDMTTWSPYYELTKTIILNANASMSIWDDLHKKGWRIAEVDIHFKPSKFKST